MGLPACVTRRTEMELDAVYFRGSYDSVDYLKKVGIRGVGIPTPPSYISKNSRNIKTMSAIISFRKKIDKVYEL